MGQPLFRKSPESALAELAVRFHHNGYRKSPPDREEHPNTHRGYEIRFSALHAAERDEILTLIALAGFKAGRPFPKGPCWRIPVYGKAATEELLHAFHALRPRKR